MSIILKDNCHRPLALPPLPYLAWVSAHTGEKHLFIFFKYLLYTARGLHTKLFCENRTKIDQKSFEIYRTKQEDKPNTIWLVMLTSCKKSPSKKQSIFSLNVLFSFSRSTKQSHLSLLQFLHPLHPWWVQIRSGISVSWNGYVYPTFIILISVWSIEIFKTFFLLYRCVTVNLYNKLARDTHAAMHGGGWRLKGCRRRPYDLIWESPTPFPCMALVSFASTN